MRLPLQQLQVAAYGRQWGTQIVGDVGNCRFQLCVPVLQPQPFPAQLLQLDIHPRGQGTDGAAAGGNEDRGIGVGIEPVLQFLGDLPQRAVKQRLAHQQDNDA